MATVTNPVQNFGETIKSFQGKAKSTEDRDLLARAKEVYEMVQDIPLDNVTAKMVLLATNNLKDRLKYLK
jgi:hypothetical protein